MTEIAPALTPAIRAALAMNEVGGDSSRAYRLSFAGQAASGASFGVFQADCAANPRALATLLRILQGAKVPGSELARILEPLRAPCRVNPLNGQDTALVDTALASAQGRGLVDALDRLSLDAVLADLGLALDAATVAGNSIDPGAQIAIALWCNMSGRPTTLRSWLGGNAVSENGVRIEAPSQPISLADIERYLTHTNFFSAHPQDWPHFLASIQAGLRRAAA
jgi:hypothetical protein